MTDRSEPDHPRQLQHIGFVVDDLERAATHFARAYGIGPFLTVPHLEFDELTFRGGSCCWEHSLAFGIWGGIQVELQEADTVEPPELAALMGAPGTLSHGSYRVADPAAESERLTELGFEAFLEASVGAVNFVCLKDPYLPTYTEVHRDNPFLARFDTAIETATADWDGRQVLIESPSPSTS